MGPSRIFVRLPRPPLTQSSVHFKCSLERRSMTFVPLSGFLDGAVAMGSPVAVAMGSLLMGLLAATTFALVLGADRRPRRRDPVISLEPPAADPAAAGCGLG